MNQGTGQNRAVVFKRKIELVRRPGSRSFEYSLPLRSEIEA